MTFHEQMFTPEGIIALCQEWFDVTVTYTFADLWSYEYRERDKLRKSEFNTNFLRDHKLENYQHVTAAGPHIWLKMKLMERELLPVSPRPAAAPPIVTAVLHFGFLTLRETAEMIELLQNELETRREAKPARSKVFSEAETHHIQPINQLAAIVASPKKE